MFNLEQTILEWRRQMLAAGVKTPVPLNELETHLRDAIEQQTKAGRSEEEAFRTAARNLGPAPVLQSEFKKLGGRVAACGTRADEIVFASVPYLVSVLAVCVGASVLSKGLHPGQQASCLAANATMLLLVWSGRLGYRAFPVLPTKRARNLLTYSSFALVAIWWTVFFYLILPSQELDADSLLTAFLWGFQTPAGALIGLMLGLETAARKPVATS